MVAASAYSWARARNPAGGAGSSMRSISIPAALGDRRVHRPDVLEDETGDHGVEAFGRKRQRGGVGLPVARSATPNAGHADLVPRRVDADDPPRSTRHRQPGHLTLAAADVEDVTGA